MNDQKIGFPSFGELVRTIYNIAGVLPAKHGEVDNAERKRIQKSLQRLAQESCPLDEMFARMTQKLSYLIAGAVEQVPMALAIGEILFDWYEVYRKVMADEGSYLSPTATMRYFLRRYTVSRLVVSIAKHADRFALDDPRAYQWPEDGPDLLPSQIEGRLVMPLESAMRWIYAHLGTSIARFHLIEDQQTGAIDELPLRNVHNWLANKTLPSWPELDRAFTRGFDQAARAGNTALAVGGLERVQLRSVLFIARACSAIARKVVAAYGEAFLEELVADLRDEAQCAGEERLCLAIAYEATIQDAAHHGAAPPSKNEFTQHWWRAYSDRALEAAHVVSRYEITDEALEWMLPRVGPLAIRQALAHACWRRFKIEPPCRSKFEPGLDAVRRTVVCG